MIWAFITPLRIFTLKQNFTYLRLEIFYFALLLRMLSAKYSIQRTGFKTLVLNY